MRLVSFVAFRSRTPAFPWLVVTLAFFLALVVQALIAPLAPATAPRISAPADLLRDKDGQPLRNAANQLLSSNWSGYALDSSKTGQKYTAVSGTWIVTKVQAVTKFRKVYSSQWVGIGGLKDSTLIQLGTEADASNSGQTTYLAWYELIPAAPVTINITVHPGDSITAGVKLTGNQIWLFTMTDNTTGKSFSRSVSYKSSQASAEWIEEAPFSGGILPLANYGKATFDPGTINGGTNPALTAADGIVMLDPKGQSSNPSRPDSDTDGFNTCWGATHSLTKCSAPPS
jgi:hypothetical protein